MLVSFSVHKKGRIIVDLIIIRSIILWPSGWWQSIMNEFFRGTLL